MKPNLFGFDYLFITLIAIRFFSDDVLNRFDFFAEIAIRFPFERHHRLESVE
jgi:hypothetical protein